MPLPLLFITAAVASGAFGAGKTAFAVSDSMKAKKSIRRQMKPSIAHDKTLKDSVNRFPMLFRNSVKRNYLYFRIP